MEFEKLLKGGDLRSIGQSNAIISMVQNQESFDALFQQLFNTDRNVVMRAADAIEKITRNGVSYLKPHKREILSLCSSAKDIELKWHLALLVPRLSLTSKELGQIWQTLTTWATDRKESRIVRVNSLQGLFDLLSQNRDLAGDFNLTIARVEKEDAPSIRARIRKLRNVRQPRQP